MNGTSMTHERERERDDRLSKPHSSEVKRRSDIMINVLLFRREREKRKCSQKSPQSHSQLPSAGL